MVSLVTEKWWQYIVGARRFHDALTSQTWCPLERERKMTRQVNGEVAFLSDRFPLFRDEGAPPDREGPFSHNKRWV